MEQRMSAISAVSIASSALVRLGDKAIISLTDDSDRARVMNTLYPTVLDAVLRAHRWNFAIARAALPALSDAPAWEYDNQFQLPAGASPAYCIRLLTTEAYELYQTPFVVEGRTVLTNAAAPLKIKYIARITDPAQYDAMFVEALIARLAAEAAYPVTGSKQAADAQWALYQLKVREAMTYDGLEGTPDALEANQLVDVRN
jgi:hypothetical protein